MSIISWKTNSISLNVPPKVLVGTADSSISLERWNYANSNDDPYWSGGSNPKYYRWTVTFTVTAKFHGSNLTRKLNRYDSQDLEVGDFVAGASDSKVCQIIKILSKTESSITAIVEDHLRYNTFKDPIGNGLFNIPGPVVFFQINELGLPMLDPVPGEVSVDFFTNVMSRFQYMNPLTNYLLEKANHGFERGDAVCIENGQFTLSNSTNVQKFIGTVLHPGPGPNQFILRPSNGIIDFVPGLPGTVGDFIYPTTDATGNLTTDASSKMPIFLKIADSIPSVTIGTTSNTVGENEDIVEINKHQILLVGASNSGFYDLNDVVTLVNQKTSEHKVAADLVNAATSTQSDFINYSSAYSGFIAGYVPFSASINGVVVNFTTTNSGDSLGEGIANVNDMASDINNALIPNIIASVTDTGLLKLTNIIGGGILIRNISPDSGSKNFAGNDSLTSLPFDTSGNTRDYSLRLSRVDGGPITLVDIQGTFFEEAGVLSGQTGRYALGLMIERGLTSSGSGGGGGTGQVSVVSNISTVVQGSTIKVDANFSNIDYPGGLFTIFQLDPVITDINVVWFSGNTIKNAYSDFTTYTIDKQDITLTANLQHANFLVKNTDDITIGSSIITNGDLLSLNISGNTGIYTIPNTLFSESQQLSSNVTITGNLTTDRGIITLGNLLLHNLQPVPFDISLSAIFPLSKVPFFNTMQKISWTVTPTGTISSGTMLLSGPDLDQGVILASFGELYGISQVFVDSLKEYTVSTNDYTGVGFNGSGTRKILSPVSVKVAVASIYYPIFYKINSSSSNPGFTINDNYLKSNYTIGQGVETSDDVAKYLWMAIPGTQDHTFAFTYLNSTVYVTPDVIYKPVSINGVGYNVYGFTNFREVTKIYTLT